LFFNQDKVLKLVQLFDVCSFENKARSIKGKTMYTHTNSQKFQLLKKVVDECTLLCNVLLITLCEVVNSQSNSNQRIPNTEKTINYFLAEND
jgi:hypothetical protein